MKTPRNLHGLDWGLAPLQKAAVGKVLAAAAAAVMDTEVREVFQCEGILRVVAAGNPSDAMLLVTRDEIFVVNHQVGLLTPQPLPLGLPQDPEILTADVFTQNGQTIVTVVTYDTAKAESTLSVFSVPGAVGQIVKGVSASLDQKMILPGAPCALTHHCSSEGSIHVTVPMWGGQVNRYDCEALSKPPLTKSLCVNPGLDVASQRGAMILASDIHSDANGQTVMVVGTSDGAVTLSVLEGVDQESDQTELRRRQ